jgi:hypothetical protein
VSRFEEFGIVALLPGLQYAVEIMQKHLDDLRSRVASLQQIVAEASVNPNGRPRPKKAAAAATFSLAEAAAEMQLSANQINRARLALGMKVKAGEAVVLTEKDLKKIRLFQAKKSRNGWHDMTPKERIAEMNRRIAKREINA